MEWDSMTPGIHLIAASPGSGKSYLTKWLVYNLWKLSKFDYGVVWNPTAHTGSYDWMPKNVYEAWTLKRARRSKEEPWQYRNETLDQVLDFQKKNPKSRCFIIFDDMIGQLDWNSNQMSSFVTTYRHYRITAFFITQYIFRVPPTVRECAKYAYIFNQQQKRSIDAVHETYFIHLDKKVFMEWLSKYCRDHHFILVKVAESDMAKKYVVTKAGPVPKFKLQF